MKHFIKTATLSFLTASSLSLTVLPQSQAFTNQFKSTNLITNQTIYRSQLEADLSQNKVSKGELVALNWKDLRPVSKPIGKFIGGWIKDRITNPSNPENQR
jgi:hypothetical protein